MPRDTGAARSACARDQTGGPASPNRSGSAPAGPPILRGGQSPSLRPGRWDGIRPGGRGEPAPKRWRPRPRRSPVTPRTQPRSRRASTGGDRPPLGEHPATGRPGGPQPRTPPERDLTGGRRGAEHPSPASAGDSRSVAPRSKLACPPYSGSSQPGGAVETPLSAPPGTTPIEQSRTSSPVSSSAASRTMRATSPAHHSLGTAPRSGERPVSGLPVHLGDPRSSI